MDYGHPVAPSHGHQQMVRPHAPLQDEEPKTDAGLRTVVADEEEHHEKKPVLKKVKDKVKKIKDTIINKRHGHGDDHDDEHYVEGEGYDEEEDEEMELEPITPTDDVNISGPKTAGPTPGNEKSVSPEVLDSLQAMAISVQREGQHGSDTAHLASDIEKKPTYTEKLSSTAAAAKDAAMSAASTVYSKVAGTTPTGTPTETRSTEEGDKKPSYTEKLSSSAAAAKDAAVSAASTMYAKVSGGTHSIEPHKQGSPPVSTGPGVEVEDREGGGKKKGTYTEKLSGTALSAKDAVVNAATTVYGKVAGSAVTGGGTEQDKGVSVREYLAEKVRPGEEDRALCEVISESMKKRGEEEHEVVEDKVGEEKGGFVLPEVTGGEVDVKRVHEEMDY